MEKINKKEIPNGEGRYVPNPKGNHGWAVYKDSEGKVLVFSADCPHKHCDVDWDSGDKKWYCPCHGSEFEPQGNLKKGPATEGLRTKPFTEQGDDIILG